MVSPNVNYNVIISLKCFNDARITLETLLKINMTQIFYIVNGCFMLKNTATNKISKTLLWRSLYKVK